MTVFNPTYNPRVYNALGDVKVVDKLVTDAELNGLGQIIVRYGNKNLIFRKFPVKKQFKF